MNVLASFQGFINKIFAKKLNIFIIVYLDNIFIYTDEDKDDPVAAVRWVLRQLRKHLLYANLKKYRFHQKEIRFLGYVMSSKGIRIEDKKIKVIKLGSKPQVSTRHPSLSRICQLLLAIHLGIQSDSCTTYLNVEDFREYWVFDTIRKERSRGWWWQQS